MDSAAESCQVSPVRWLLIFLVACGSKSDGPTQGERVRTAIQDVNGHVVVLSPTNFAAYRETLATVLGFDSEIVAAGPMLFVEANLLTKQAASPILLKGVSANHTLLRSDLSRYIVTGSLDTKVVGAMPIAIGSQLASNLGLALGARVDLDVIERMDKPPRGTAEVVAIFRTDFPEYDSVLVVTQLEAVQALLGKGDVAMGIELKLKNPAEATRVAAGLGKKLGAEYKVIDWCELNKSFLQCEDSHSPALPEYK